MQCGCSTELFQACGDASGTGAADLRPSPPSAAPPCHSRFVEEPEVGVTLSTRAISKMSVILTIFCGYRCTRSSSVVCNAQVCHMAPETTASLPGLACPGWRDRPGLMSPCSPFPLLTSLGLLLETITSIHKDLSRKVGPQEKFK